MKQSDFRQGQKWRVIRENASLQGMHPIAPYCHTGWSMKLTLGTILTCTGVSMSFGDGVPMVKWADEHGKFLANDCEFRPTTGGMWASAPADGYLGIVWPTLTSFEQTAAWTLYEIRVAIEEYDFKLDAWDDFEAQANCPILIERATKFRTPDKPNFVVWDPIADDEGWLLVSPDAKAIGRETMEMIASSASHGPLAIYDSATGDE